MRGNGKDQRLRRQNRYLLEILDRIVLEILVDARVDRMCIGGFHDDRISVARRSGDEVRPDRSVGTRLVLDDDLLAKPARHLLSDVSRENIRKAAWHPGHNQPDRLARIRIIRHDGLRTHDACKQQCNN